MSQNSFRATDQADHKEPGMYPSRKGMSESLTFDLPNLAATETLGRHLGSLLFPGAVIGLTGPLGAGKTQLVRAVAQGLGLTNSRVVTSPTFVLIQEYQGRLPIYHFDAYRLRSPNEFLDLGVLEYFEGDGVCLVEWADRVPTTFPSDHLWVQMAVTGENSRRLTITGHGERSEGLVRRLPAKP